VLTSAVANANEAEADVETLVISEAFVNDGPVHEEVYRERPRPGACDP